MSLVFEHLLHRTIKMIFNLQNVRERVMKYYYLNGTNILTKISREIRSTIVQFTRLSSNVH